MGFPAVYENRDVVALVGVPERALRYWADRGVVVPEVADAVGRPGIRRRYSFANVVQCGVVKELLGYGINLHEAGDVLAFLRKTLYFTQWPEQCFLVIQEGVAVGTLLGGTRPGHTDTLTARFPKYLKWLKRQATLGGYLERILEDADAGDSLLVVAVHQICERLRGQAGRPAGRRR